MSDFRTRLFAVHRLALAAAALAPVNAVEPAVGVDILISASVGGKTPERIGYNSGHFMAGSNAAAWWKYTEANAARVWSTPAIVEGSDDDGVFGDGVTSQQQFIDRRAALRADPLNPTYINWNHFEGRFENNPTTGSNNVNLAYAFGQLHSMGIEPVIEIHRTNAAYPFAAAGTSAGWGSRWEQWQHFYAQAFYLAKNFDVRRFQMYNEPNHSSNDISQAEYLERLRLASDAVQSAVADVNAMYGKSLEAQMHAPVTAGGTTIFNARPGGDPRDNVTGWGQLVMQNLHTNYLGEMDPNFQLVHTYAAQIYNTDGPGFAGQVQGLRDLVTAAAGGTPMRIALTEFNVHTAAVFENTTDTMDSPSKFSLLGSILANLANSRPEELYIQKFSLTQDTSASGVKKNGVHYVDNVAAPYNIGGITKGGEVSRLFNRAFAGAHDLMVKPTASGAGASNLQLAASHNVDAGRYSLFSANLGAENSSLDLNFNLSSWGIEPGAIVTVEEVSPNRQGEVRHLIEVPQSQQLSLPQPGQSVWLVTIPEKAPAYRPTLAATDDAMVKSGVNSNLNYGLSGNLYAKNHPTNANARNVTFIKFDLGQMQTSGVEQAVLKVFGENEGSATSVIAHVYGVLDDQWDELSIKWNNAPNLAPGTGIIDNIGDNFIEDVGGSAAVLGHLTGGKTPGEIMLDVTSFVKDHPDSQVTFLITREFRYLNDNIDDAATSLKLASNQRGANPGPQLVLSLAASAVPGDFDGNGVVDAADLTRWEAGVGKAHGATAADGDADFDGDVDGADFLVWQTARGTSLPPSVATAAAVVPEPSAAVLITFLFFWRIVSRR